MPSQGSWVKISGGGIPTGREFKPCPPLHIEFDRLNFDISLSHSDCLEFSRPAVFSPTPFQPRSFSWHTQWYVHGMWQSDVWAWRSTCFCRKMIYDNALKSSFQAVNKGGEMSIREPSQTRGDRIVRRQVLRSINVHREKYKYFIEILGLGNVLLSTHFVCLFFFRCKSTRFNLLN